MEGVARMPVDGATSMYYDRMAGRPTEHDALYGAVVRAGARHGIPTPFAETVAALLAGGDEADGIVG
jgi:2-dehydropantoate 2-reductase